MPNQRLTIEVTDKTGLIYKTEIFCDKPPTVRTYIENQDESFTAHYINDYQKYKEHLDFYKNFMKEDMEKHIGNFENHLRMIGQGFLKKERSPEKKQGGGRAPRKQLETRSSVKESPLCLDENMCKMHKKLLKIKRKRESEDYEDSEDSEDEHNDKRKKNKVKVALFCSTNS